MIYFFHHYELPAILQQARIQQIIIENQQQGQDPNAPNNSDRTDGSGGNGNEDSNYNNENNTSNDYVDENLNTTQSTTNSSREEYVDREQTPNSESNDTTFTNDVNIPNQNANKFHHNAHDSHILNKQVFFQSKLKYYNQKNKLIENDSIDSNERELAKNLQKLFCKI